MIETLTVRQLILAGKEFYIVVGHKEQVTSNLILTLLIQTICYCLTLLIQGCVNKAICYCLTLLIQAFLAEASASSPWQYFPGFPYCTILWAATGKLCIIYLHPVLWQLCYTSQELIWYCHKVLPWGIIKSIDPWCVNSFSLSYFPMVFTIFCMY